MIWWDEKLYTDDKVARHPARYRKRVEKKGLRGAFVWCWGVILRTAWKSMRRERYGSAMKRNAVYK